MRVPKESQLSLEQKEVCFAPHEDTILVTGPPGSGKTVVAFHRALAVKKLGDDVFVVMYNRVLQRFTESAGQSLKLDPAMSNGAGLIGWLYSWWRSTTGTQFPKQRDESSGWWGPDYKEAAARAMNGQLKTIQVRGNWGHMVLDEAQDFPPEAHYFLFSVSRIVFAGVDPEERPVLTILADENQRITESNSTIGEIKKAQGIGDDDSYELHENYRNTREIAELAGHFFVDLPTGRPDLPKRRGEKPAVIVTPDLNDAVDRIVKYARLHDDQEIGVFVQYNNTRKRLFNRLSAKLKGSGIAVQSYSSKKNDPNNDSTKLVFDRGGTVSVFCYASGKGLEFDAVFLPELQTLQIDAEKRDITRMNLYVMTSRARERLFLMISDPGRTADIWGLLPKDPSLFVLEA